jgi:hypothetical protein
LKVAGLLVILIFAVFITGCIGCAETIYRGGWLQNEANTKELIFLSDPDPVFNSGTFSVDTSLTVQGSVFGTSGKTIQGRYSWEGNNLTLMTDDGNHYIFSQSEDAECTLTSGFENSAVKVTQFKYWHLIKQC